MHKLHAPLVVALFSVTAIIFSGCDINMKTGVTGGGNITRDTDGDITITHGGNGTVTINGKVISSSGPVVKGSGVAATEVREVEDFSKISLSTALSVDISVGGTSSVTVTADDNIVPLVKSDVKNNVLHVYISGSTQPSVPIKVEIAATELASLVASGSCNATINGIDAQTFETELSGACSVTIVGETDQFNCEVSGASRVTAVELVAKGVNVEASGASHATVFATDSIKANSSGASNVQFAGEPPTVKKNKSGASTISAR